MLLGWLASGSVVALLAVVPEALEFGWEAPAGDVAGSVMLIATVPLLLVGTVVDSLRRRRIRFRGATHHVLGWTVMAGATAIAYALVVAGLGQVVGGDGPTWLLVAATGVIALAAEPARRRIQRSVDRLVWGARDDPLAVVRHVVDLVGPDSGNDLLPALVRSLQRDLRFDSVAIDVVATTDGIGSRRSAHRAVPSTTSRSNNRATSWGVWSWPRAAASRCVNATPRCSPNSPVHSHWRSVGSDSPVICGGRVSRSCRRARRSDAGSVETCTTASGRR